MKKIALIAYGPGTANTLFPLIPFLRKNFHVELFPFHPYAAQLWGAELKQRQDFNAIFSTPWDLIVTGTGSLHYVEKATPFLAKEHHIQTLSILDSPGNYRERFQYTPDYIICLDESSKNEIADLGIRRESIFALGNPHFDRLEPFVQFSIPSPPYRVVFFSQPMAAAKEAFYHLLKLRDQIPNLFHTIYATNHPREDGSWLENICSSESHTIYASYESSFSWMMETDVNMGISSTLQYESMIIQKPSIFYQSFEQLKKDFLELPLFQPQTERSIDFRATERCITFISQLLNS